MKNLETHKVVMLPREKASHIVKDYIVGNHNQLTFVNDSNRLLVNGNYQHLYILSDEEIKDGDWFISPLGNIMQFTDTGMNPVTDVTEGENGQVSRKIIATTDSSLKSSGMANGKLYGQQFEGTKFEDKGLPPIPESFIKAYIKAYNEGNPITEVQLEYELVEGAEFNTEDSGKMKWSEYPIKLKLKDDGTVIVHQAKTYTREQLFRGMEWAFMHAKSIGEFDKWIEENL